MYHGYFANTPKNMVKRAKLFALLVEAQHILNIPYTLFDSSKASHMPAFGEALLRLSDSMSACCFIFL
jgi:hypothetical protein